MLNAFGVISFNNLTIFHHISSVCHFSSFDWLSVGLSQFYSIISIEQENMKNEHFRPHFFVFWTSTQENQQKKNHTAELSSEKNKSKIKQWQLSSRRRTCYGLANRFYSWRFNYHYRTTCRSIPTANKTFFKQQNNKNPIKHLHASSIPIFTWTKYNSNNIIRQFEITKMSFGLRTVTEDQVIWVPVPGLWAICQISVVIQFEM